MKSFVYMLSLVLFYLITRVFIFNNGPKDFTEIIYSYMPYAHLWASGETPYLKHWFEYPPATIVWFYLPHLYDMTTLGSIWHLTYLTVYRLMMLGIDLTLFLLILRGLVKLKANKSIIFGGIVYYSLATAKAHHFIYDSMDWVFVFSIFLGVMAPILWNNFKGKFIFWVGYFLAIAFKLVNAPLGMIYLWANRGKWKREIVHLIIALVLVWSIPLVYFRSSLLVIFEYHKQRGVQIESTPATLVRTINAITSSEKVIEVYKNYEMSGPVSERVKIIFNYLFYGGIGFYLVWGMKVISQSKVKILNLQLLWLTQGFIFFFMLFAKVLSTPFLLWHIPLLAVFPYKNIKQQLQFTIPSLLILLISMTKVTDIPVGLLSLHILIGWGRIFLFSYLLFNWLNLKVGTQR